VARTIAQQRGVTEGPVCLLTCVEPFVGYDIYRNAQRKKLELVSRYRKCLHYYWYEFHPDCGFLNLRLRTWFPFDVQVCLNGREWLARQMDHARLGYERADNCFTDLEDFAEAQALLSAQLQSDWPALLDGIAQRLFPLREELFGDLCPGYYWTTYQSEWATDLVVTDPAGLRRLYPLLLRHGMTTLGSSDVLRFLGRQIPAQGTIPGTIRAEVTSDVKARPEGVRLKHRVNTNSVKLYDKAYTAQRAVLRVESTLNDVSDLKVYRPKEGGAEEERAWRPLRKGVADLHRRAEVSQGANKRYLEALSSVDDSTTLEERVGRVTVPTTWKGKRVRALQPFAPGDMALLAAVSRGEWTLNGLRNRDLRRELYGEEEGVAAEEVRRRAGRVTRQLRRLRAHGLIQKVPKTHRYQVTAQGREILTAILSARHTPISQLAKAA
jgi:DNA-binding PadR family transcriptional regulator